MESAGSINWCGITSGCAGAPTNSPRIVVKSQDTIDPGGYTIRWPNNAGTVPVSASLPLILNSTTGNLTCPTCINSITSLDRSNSTINDGAPVTLLTSTGRIYSISAYLLCRTTGAGTSVALSTNYTDNSGVQTGPNITAIACDAGGNPHSSISSVPIYATNTTNITFQVTDVGGASYDLFIRAVGL